MATSNRIRNYTYPDSVLGLPPGRWVTVGAVKHYRPYPPKPVVVVETPPKPVAKCGTPSGWKRHRRAHEQPCIECRRAVADYRRGLRARRSGVEVAA